VPLAKEDIKLIRLPFLSYFQQGPGLRGIASADQGYPIIQRQLWFSIDFKIVSMVEEDVVLAFSSSLSIVGRIIPGRLRKLAKVPSEGFENLTVSGFIAGRQNGD